MHGVAVGSPLREFGTKCRELLSIGLDMSGVFIEKDLLSKLVLWNPLHHRNIKMIRCSSKKKKETYSAVRSLESIELRLSLTIKGLLRHSSGSDETLESIYGDIPNFFMVATQSNNNTCRLSVEGAWNVQDGLVDQFYNLRVGDWGVSAQGIVGATGLGDFDKGLGGGSHFCDIVIDARRRERSSR